MLHDNGTKRSGSPDDSHPAAAAAIQGGICSVAITRSSSESTGASCRLWRSLSTQRGEDRRGKLALARGCPVIGNLLLLVDQRCHARSLARSRVVRSSVGDGDAQVCVAEQRELKAVVEREGRVLGLVVVAAADDHNVLSLELWQRLLEGAALGGSSASGGTRIEPQHDLLPLEVRQRDRGAGVALACEGRSRRADRGCWHLRQEETNRKVQKLDDPQSMNKVVFFHLKVCMSMHENSENPCAVGFRDGTRAIHRVRL